MTSSRLTNPRTVGAIFLLTLVSGKAVLGKNPVAEVYDHQVDLIEHDVVGLARAMPADKYDFAPSQGAFAGVRTFGEQVKHIATMIYMTAALVLDEKPPVDLGTSDNGPDSIRSKEEILKYLEGSRAYAHKATASLTEKNQMDPIQTYFGPMARCAVAVGVAYHSYDHYGQMVVYARMNGIVPPSSQR